MKVPSAIPIYLLGAVKIALAIATAVWASGCANQAFYGRKPRTRIEPDNHFSEFSP